MCSGRAYTVKPSRRQKLRACMQVVMLDGGMPELGLQQPSLGAGEAKQVLRRPPHHLVRLHHAAPHPCPTAPSHRILTPDLYTASSHHTRFISTPIRLAILPHRSFHLTITPQCAQHLVRLHDGAPHPAPPRPSAWNLTLARTMPDLPSQGFVVLKACVRGLQRSMFEIGCIVPNA